MDKMTSWVELENICILVWIKRSFYALLNGDGVLIPNVFRKLWSIEGDGPNEYNPFILVETWYVF
jgi:hypothetical protein